MQHEQNQIVEFMVKAEQATPDRPTIPNREVRILRVKLIAEELMELCEALNVNLNLATNGIASNCVVEADEKICQDDQGCLRDAYDAILDLMVVVVGTGVAMGMKLEPGWEEVHRSNMSKFIDGYRRTDGKWIKGPSYSPASLWPILLAQIDAAETKAKQQVLPV